MDRKVLETLAQATPEDANETVAITKHLIIESLPLLPIKYRLLAVGALLALKLFGPMIVRAIGDLTTTARTDAS